MAYELTTLQIDFATDKAQVSVTDKSTQTMIHVFLKVGTPGDQNESGIREQAKKAAKKALQEAASAL